VTIFRQKYELVHSITGCHTVIALSSILCCIVDLKIIIHRPFYHSETLVGTQLLSVIQKNTTILHVLVA